jgi:hypothetical protein
MGQTYEGEVEWRTGQTYEGEKSELEVTMRNPWTSDPCFLCLLLKLMLQLVGYIISS